MAEIGDEDQAYWDEACRREAAIRNLLNRYPRRLRISAVKAAAWELGVSWATLYRLITPRFRAPFERPAWTQAVQSPVKDADQIRPNDYPPGAEARSRSIFAPQIGLPF
jgi:hypothetical protein